MRDEVVLRCCAAPNAAWTAAIAGLCAVVPVVQVAGPPALVLCMLWCTDIRLAAEIGGAQCCLLAARDHYCPSCLRRASLTNSLLHTHVRDTNIHCTATPCPQILFITLALMIVWTMKYKQPQASTYDADADSFPTTYLVLPCLLLFLRGFRLAPSRFFGRTSAIAAIWGGAGVVVHNPYQGFPR